MKKDLLQFVVFLAVLCFSDEVLIGSCALYCPNVTSGPCKDFWIPLLLSSVLLLQYGTIVLPY
jgi:hypothetical protein